MTATDTELAALASRSAIPALVASAGDEAALGFLDYFTVNIRNKNTQADYAWAAVDFLK